MRPHTLLAVSAGLLLLLLPGLVQAQGIAQEIRSLDEVLKTLYDDTVPLCGKLIGIGKGLAAFGAVLYIAYRVWGHIARAEPIDFYPLFRPFCLGLAVMMFTHLISIFNSILEPTVTGTRALVDNSNKAVAELLKKKEEEIKKTDKWKMMVGENENGDRDLWMKYYHKEQINNESWLRGIRNDIAFSMAKMSYNFRNAIKRVIATILEILYEAAALCINTLRTFRLLILALIGPLVFGLAVFDGLHHTLSVYVARYVNIFLWLPIANILGALLGKIQENMIKLDLSQIIQNGDTSFSSYDLGYTIFMIIGIVCYATVPSIADEVVHVGGGGGLQNRVTHNFNAAKNVATHTATAGTAGMINDMYGDARSMMSSGTAASGGSNYFPDSNRQMRNKLDG